MEMLCVSVKIHGCYDAVKRARNILGGESVKHFNLEKETEIVSTRHGTAINIYINSIRHKRYAKYLTENEVMYKYLHKVGATFSFIINNALKDEEQILYEERFTFSHISFKMGRTSTRAYVDAFRGPIEKNDMSDCMNKVFLQTLKCQKFIISGIDIGSIHIDMWSKKISKMYIFGDSVSYIIGKIKVVCKLSDIKINLSNDTIYIGDKRRMKISLKRSFHFEIKSKMEKLSKLFIKGLKVNERNRDNNSRGKYDGKLLNKEKMLNEHAQFLRNELLEVHKNKRREYFRDKFEFRRFEFLLENGDSFETYREACLEEERIEYDEWLAEEREKEIYEDAVRTGDPFLNGAW